MKETARWLRSEIPRLRSQMELMASGQLVERSRPEKWSRQEILGHLIDSAVNNYHRFVRAQHGEAADFPTYRQDDWVAAQHYNERDWLELVELWSALNNHLAHIIEHMPESAKDTPVNFNEDKPARLEYVVTDYLEHMRHHLAQILAD
jgi:hypothetical protein